MFIALLIANLAVSFAVCLIIATIFKKSITTIMKRIISEEIYTSWVRYIIFAVYVVGVSGGVRIWDMEKYISPVGPDKAPLVLNNERWILEIYRTLIGTLQSDATMLLVFFIFALIAFVIVKGLEVRKNIST